MPIEKISTKPAASAGENVLNTADEKPDFKALFAAKLAAMTDNFQETGLTAAQQALYDAGGAAILEAKRELDSDKESPAAAQPKADSSRADPAQYETIKKYMPDGSILVIKTRNGKTIDEYRKKPHMIAVPDPSRPPLIENGQEKLHTKLVPRHNLLDSLT
jgi:hypothetical protein